MLSAVQATINGFRSIIKMVATLFAIVSLTSLSDSKN